MAIVHDVSRPEDWDRSVAAVQAQFGGLDVLVNNAGILHHASVDDTDLEDYLRVVQVNQIGPFLGMRAVVAPMRLAGGGSIVNVSSVRGLTGANGLLAYTATKFAVRGMTEGRGAGARPVRHPGQLPASRGGGDRHRWQSALRRGGARRPLRRSAHPPDRAARELAHVALFLASDESSYCTGAEFVADGGHTAGVRRPGPGY